MQVAERVTERDAARVDLLPFQGRAESFQLLGLGRWDVAEALCAPASPVRFGARSALVQLSLMRWTASPVGPYWATFVGLVMGAPAEARAPSLASRLLPRESRVLSAFLRASKVLWVPAYAVGAVDEGDSVSREAREESRRFGRAALGMHKTRADFRLTRAGEALHVQVVEAYETAGRTFHGGFSATLTSPAAKGMTISPSLLACPELYGEVAKGLREPAQSGAMWVPPAERGGAAVCVATTFLTRPRLVAWSAQKRAAFSPLVLDRPCPPRSLGGLLERLEFTPEVLLHDPALEGTILGPRRGLAEALL